MLIKILNKCIGMISEKEIAQFKVDHTLATAYEPTLSDMVYKFRYPIAVIGILLLQIVAWMVAFELLRRRNYHKLEEKNEQLAVAVAQANSANEAKGQFLARMSHEIRTPLNAIVGFSNILALDDGVSPEERLEYIGSINKNSDLLLKLINDILELSRIESGYMSFEYEKCFISELVDSIYMTHQMLISEQLEFIKELDAVQVEVMVDKGRLTQVITNFLNNASKFTKTGYIKLGYRYLSESDRVAIYVEDTGRGIELSEQKMIFSRFYKQDEFSQGAGLGLSICQVIVEKLRGKIELWSEPGKGSRFTVVLPVVKATSDEL